MGLGGYEETNSKSSSEEDEKLPAETKTCEVQQLDERIEPNGKYIDTISI